MDRRVFVITNHSDRLLGFRKELLLELGKDNSVYVSSPDNGTFGELEKMGCVMFDTPIDRRGINPLKDVRILMTYRKLFKSVKPQFVIAYTIKPNIYGGIVCRFMNIPYAVNITGLGTAFQKKGLLRSAVIAMYKFALKKVKVVFFENVENQQTFIDERIIPASKTCLLNGAGVNLEHFSYKQYPKIDNKTHFLYIGRVMREKGIEELFTAMKKLKKDGFNCVLDIVGMYEDDYKEIITQGEHEGWIVYHGYQSDVRPFIEQTHCSVLPSWHEGMANTNLESASMGRPLITSNIHGCKEAVLDGKSGLLCEVKNAESLYLKMKEFINLSYEEREQMGKNGRQHMENIFDKKLVVEKTIRNMF